MSNTEHASLRPDHVRRLVSLLTARRRAETAAGAKAGAGAPWAPGYRKADALLNAAARHASIAELHAASQQFGK